MDQLVKEESQKLIAKQMRQARVQRQMQVRQQALAWTEATRKKFDETKEREIKRLADTVTDEAQNRAIQSIQHLTEQNDLAMAEIGMAHRAAAGYHNVEKLKSLKRLKDEEVAKNRGVSAIMKQKKENMSKSATSLAMLKRKEAVRKTEDQKSKELISRRPLKVTNTNIDTRLKPEVNLGPPDYQPSLANTLRIAPEHASQAGDHKMTRKTSRRQKGSLPVVVSSSSDVGLRSRPQVVKEGVLTKMARIKTLYDPRSTVPADQAETNNLLQKGLELRKKYHDPKRSKGLAAAIPENPTVRYFDVSIPKGEVKYIAPKGLAVKESNYSPDAWEKGRESTQKILDDEMNKTKKIEEISQKAEERGKLALKKARLEKQMSQVRNDLLQEIDFQIMGSGSQTAILGLGDDSDTNSVVLHNQDLSSGEFSAVETDEEFEFPQPTMKTFAVGEDKTDKHIMLVPIDDNKLLIKESNYSPDVRERRRESQSTQKTLDVEMKQTQKDEISHTSIMGLDEYSDVNPVVQQNHDLSSDDFSTVETDEEFEFPQPIMKTSGVGKDKTDKHTMLEPADDKGLLIKEPIYSPDARERRRESQSTQKSLDEETKQTQKADEVSQKVAEREKLGSKKARLEKQISQIRNDLLQEAGGDNGLAINESNYNPDAKQSSLSRISDDESLLVKLTIKESTQTTPLSSERSSVSTDYYSPPDGPFTSTPDGKLHPKPNLFNANKTGRKSAPTIKRLTLYHYVDKFLARRPESIEALPVTSSSSSVIRADSDVLTTESFEALREKSSSSNHSHSRSGSDSSQNKSSSNEYSHSRSDSSGKKSSSHSSVDLTWKNFALPTVSEEDSELESGSTIAEAAVVAGLGDLETQSTANTSSNKSSSSSRGSSNGSTSNSLTGMLNTLSRHHAIEKSILEKEGQSSSPGGNDTVLSYSQALGIENLNETQGSQHSMSESSNGSLPDVSHILRQLRSRHNRVLNSSQSSRSTPKSGPEKETERVELLSDITPIKFWETPPQQPVQNEQEQVSAVFDQLKGKWSNVKIDPPDWFVN